MFHSINGSLGHINHFHQIRIIDQVILNDGREHQFESLIEFLF